MTDTIPEAPAEGTTIPEAPAATSDVNVAEHLAAIQGSDRSTDPGRLPLEIGLYDPSDPKSSRYATVDVPEGIHSISDFALVYGLNAAELLGANGDDNIKAGEKIRVPKTMKPMSLAGSPDDRPDYNEAGASAAEVSDIHAVRDDVPAPEAAQ